MSYEGVKFKLIRLSDQIPDHPWLPELQKWCTLFHEYDLAPFYEGGSHGNLSFRIDKGQDKFIITAANSSLEESTANELFYTVSDADLQSSTIYFSGSPLKTPSSESMLHYAIYRKRPDIMAILHGHCEVITKNASDTGIICTKNFVESGTMEIVASVMEVLDQHNFIEIKNHGFISLGKTIDEAGMLSMKMKKNASR